MVPILSGRFPGDGKITSAPRTLTQDEANLALCHYPFTVFMSSCSPCCAFSDSSYNSHSWESPLLTLFFYQPYVTNHRLLVTEFPQPVSNAAVGSVSSTALPKACAHFLSPGTAKAFHTGQAASLNSSFQRKFKSHYGPCHAIGVRNALQALKKRLPGADRLHD